MTRKVVRMITSQSGTRKVEIFQRPDGTYGFEDWEYGSEEHAWYSVGRYSHAIIDSLTNAETEARSRVPWLRDLDQKELDR